MSLKIPVFFLVKFLLNINKVYKKTFIYSFFLYYIILIIDINIIDNNVFSKNLALKTLNQYKLLHYLQVLLFKNLKILSIIL